MLGATAAVPAVLRSRLTAIRESSCRSGRRPRSPTPVSRQPANGGGDVPVLPCLIPHRTGGLFCRPGPGRAGSVPPRGSSVHAPDFLPGRTPGRRVGRELALCSQRRSGPRWPSFSPLALEKTQVRADEGFPAGANPPTAWRTVTAWLDWLPVASLLLAADCWATAVNSAWLALSSMTEEDSLGRGWLNAVAPPEREAFGKRVRLAAARGKPGSDGCHLMAADGQWSRWWWQLAPSGGLVCITVMEEGQGSVPPGAAITTDLASAVVDRIFRAGLILQSAAGLSDGPTAVRLQRAVDELDDLVRDIRNAVFNPHAAFLDCRRPRLAGRFAVVRVLPSR
jgi:hypothetical protein